MTFSVNTNGGALVALQYLTATQGQLNQTQSHINSGLKVANARDDGAIYAIAQNQRASVAGYSAVINSINNATSSIDVALSAGQSISDLLIQLKTKALAAADSSLDTASRNALNSNFTALRDQITTIVKNAVFNNFNMVDVTFEFNTKTGWRSAYETKTRFAEGQRHLYISYVDPADERPRVRAYRD